MVTIRFNDRGKYCHSLFRSGQGTHGYVSKSREPGSHQQAKAALLIPLVATAGHPHNREV